MPMVFAGVCSHAPGITGRAERGDPVLRDGLCKGFERMRQAIEDSGAEALVVIGAEHFANFFMNNMPAYCVGMGDYYEGPIEDPEWLGIQPVRAPGNPDLSRRMIKSLLNDIDVAYAEEWKFDHGIIVPLNFLTPNFDLDIVPVNINCQGPPLTPLHRVYEFGRALRRACDAQPENIAVVGTGGISHWPATPDSGKIDEAWDRDFLEKFLANRREDLVAYTDEETYRDAGQGGFEIRTFVAIAGATEGASGELWYYEPIPIFAVGCTVAVMDVKPAVAKAAE
jgi:aromatic ring-opening dioxygenase catalytic subunit (LigB family)